jgi:hypothetical protein
MPTPPPEPVVRVGRLELAIGPAGDGGADRYECRLRGGLAQCRPTGPAGELASRLGLHAGRPAADYVVWEVRVEPLDLPVSGVRLRLGTADRWGPPLCQFPLVDAEVERGTLIRMFVNPDSQEIPLAELWDLIQREPVLVEVELEDSVQPLAIGPLRSAARLEPALAQC